MTTNKVQASKDGEVLGLDTDGALIQFDADAGTSYNSGETPEEFGRHNLTAQELQRIEGV